MAKTMGSGVRWLVAVLGAGVLAGACAHDDNGKYNMAVRSADLEARGGGPNVTLPEAAQGIAQARCEREARCDDIGPGKRHASPTACYNDVINNRADDLTGQSCPGGVENQHFARCLNSIRNEGCGRPLDTISRIANCRTGELCHSSF